MLAKERVLLANPFLYDKNPFASTRLVEEFHGRFNLAIFIQHRQSNLIPRYLLVVASVQSNVDCIFYQIIFTISSHLK